MKKYIVTGTSVYGPQTSDSDIDIVVLPQEAKEIQRELTDKKIYRTEAQEDYGDLGGFYFMLGGLTFNIIIAANKEEFELWERRTERMKGFSPYEERAERHFVFQEGK